MSDGYGSADTKQWVVERTGVLYSYTLVFAAGWLYFISAGFVKLQVCHNPQSIGIYRHLLLVYGSSMVVN